MTKVKSVACSPDARRLYEDLLKKGYNKLIRPVSNSSDTLIVRIGLRLTQIIDVDEKNQIMTTNVWLEQKWSDTKLSWNPASYGNVERLYVPSDEIWLPDIVLYNSADGNFTVKLMTKATIHHNGTVVWKPPAIYKSLCPIDVEFFPFDEQKCTLKIGSWSYDGFSVDIKHISLRDGAMEFETIADGIDLADYYKSTEWDLLAVPAKKYCKYYPCCSEPYPDIKFSITIRRKTLFHTVNLILPCVAICSVTLLVFYIPANSGEKITMGITILNSLNIFLLLVAEINPPTSLAIPLIGKYLLFTMVLVTCSIIVTVFVLNVHFRSPSTHVMSPWIQELFLNVLPKLLFMRRPRSCKDGLGECVCVFAKQRPIRSQAPFLQSPIGRGTESWDDDLSPIRSIRNLKKCRTLDDESCENDGDDDVRRVTSDLPPVVMQAVIGVNFIADHLKQQEEFNKKKQDWQFVAMVLDRLFLWMFTAACVVGTFGIIVQAPTLYDNRLPIPKNAQ
ncbi:hypothetical protein HELRODRAFT_69301 [Helobdella robusta]|uniref:Uncharacterized protein n=1 Tax=Helobdella robusta TaxID=6412 RepID=T1FZT1_HELRO|nr:hypothetical protein HELRODRAFT_69301 [Helobdella robusta]ESN92655.1 hypothetical protein HELRODRAFT_69301 [Helobdella robusta]